MSFKNEIDYKLKIFVTILLFVITNVFIVYNKNIKYFNGLIILYFILVIIILNGFKQKKESFIDLDAQMTADKNNVSKQMDDLGKFDTEYKVLYNKISDELNNYYKIKRNNEETLDKLQSDNLEHRVLNKLLQILKINNYRE
jgi:hypothetical protein